MHLENRTSRLAEFQPGDRVVLAGTRYTITGVYGNLILLRVLWWRKVIDWVCGPFRSKKYLRACGTYGLNAVRVSRGQE